MALNVNNLQIIRVQGSTDNPNTAVIQEVDWRLVKYSGTSVANFNGTLTVPADIPAFTAYNSVTTQGFFNYVTGSTGFSGVTYIEGLLDASLTLQINPTGFTLSLPSLG